MYVETTLTPYLLAVPLLGTPTSSQVNKGTACQTSGTLSVTGTADGSTTNLAASYSACKVVHYTIDGTVTITGTNTKTTGTFNWHGFLTLTGPQNGACWMDVVLSVTDQGTSLTGTVCGAMAADLPAAAKRAGLAW